MLANHQRWDSLGSIPQCRVPPESVQEHPSHIMCNWSKRDKVMSLEAEDSGLYQKKAEFQQNVDKLCFSLFYVLIHVACDMLYIWEVQSWSYSWRNLTRYFVLISFHHIVLYRVLQYIMVKINTSNFYTYSSFINHIHQLFILYMALTEIQQEQLYQILFVKNFSFTLISVIQGKTKHKISIQMYRYKRFSNRLHFNSTAVIVQVLLFDSIILITCLIKGWTASLEPKQDIFKEQCFVPLFRVTIISQLQKANKNKKTILLIST